MYPFIWDISSEIFTIGNFPIRYYSLLFALGFVVGKPLISWIIKKEGVKNFDVDKFLGGMIIATTLGARLGHCFFYQWDYFSHHLLEIILPFQFYPHFKITGFAGLASHGAAVAITIFLFLYSKYYFDVSIKNFNFSIRRKRDFRFLWLADKVVICVALAGGFIRLGNFMNSEVYGVPTSDKAGIIFTNGITTEIKNTGSFIEEVSVKKSNLSREKFYQPIDISIFFTKNAQNEEAIKNFIEGEIHKILSSKYRKNIYDHIMHRRENPITYSLVKNNGKYTAMVNTLGIVRHPSQLYEAISCFFIFLFLLFYWYVSKFKPKDGRIFGIFLFAVFSLRFYYEKFKSADLFFKNGFMDLTIPQALSIPAIIFGVLIFFWSDLEKFFKKK